MSDAWSRTIALLLAGLLPAQAVVAQTQSSAPTANAATGLSFPATVGGATLERSVNYAAPPTNQPDQGFSYFYSTPKKLPIVVHIYDDGRRVPPGSSNPTVVDEFMAPSSPPSRRHGTAATATSSALRSPRAARTAA